MMNFTLPQTKPSEYISAPALPIAVGCINVASMKLKADKADTAWRKSRLAARLLLCRESRPLRPRELILARRLAQDAEVTNRLIQQALYFLGIGARKHDFDQKLVDGRN